MATKRIFIVEDEGIVAADLEDRLKRMGYVVAGKAASGEKAVEQVATTKPDLVLMDIILKGEMDGVEAAELIQKQQEIPVVFLTAHADDPTLKRARLAGPFGYVLKPFDERELRGAIEIAFYRAHVESELRHANHELEKALAEIKTLHGLLPICAWCKKIRDDEGYWQKLETYLTRHTDAKFTHGICPDCLTDLQAQLKAETSARGGKSGAHSKQSPTRPPR